jgi:hypothetical protein
LDRAVRARRRTTPGSPVSRDGRRRAGTSLSWLRASLSRCCDMPCGLCSWPALFRERGEEQVVGMAANSRESAALSAATRGHGSAPTHVRRDQCLEEGEKIPERKSKREENKWISEYTHETQTELSYLCRQMSIQNISFLRSMLFLSYSTRQPVQSSDRCLPSYGGGQATSSTWRLLT